MIEFIVTRDCCTSGNCDKCHGVTPLRKCIRVVQWGPTTDEEKAKKVAHYWREYDAKVEVQQETAK
jgi:hypothetical protein